MRYVADRGVEKIRTHISCPTIFFVNRVVYEIMWKNVVEPDGRQLTIWRMRMLCWTPKTTDTLSGYIIFTAFPLQQWLQERAAMLRYAYIS